MATITHDDTVKIVLLNQDTVLEDRQEILGAADSSLVLNIKFIEPTEDIPSYGDCEIAERLQEDGAVIGCSSTAVCLYKGAVLPEALKLALKETFLYFSKNKIKPEIVYVNDPGCHMSKLEVINLTLIIQNIMKDFKSNASLWMETIKSNDINTLSMDAKETKSKKDKKDKKDKKKKKKDKKKGK